MNVYDPNFFKIVKGTLTKKMSGVSGKKKLINFFWDLKNDFCCKRHLRDFPSGPHDVNALNGSKKTTVQHEVEKMYECPCNRRHLAREIVRELNV